jgi:hypothetical protein
MAELADAADSKSADLRVLGVRLPLPAPRFQRSYLGLILVQIPHKTGRCVGKGCERRPVARDELGFTALDPRECAENFEGTLVPASAAFWKLLTPLQA